MEKSKLILKVSSLHSICGGVKVIGTTSSNISADNNVLVYSSKNRSFYASVISSKVVGELMELSLKNFGVNEIKKGMQIFKA